MLCPAAQFLCCALRNSNIGLQLVAIEVKVRQHYLHQRTAFVDLELTSAGWPRCSRWWSFGQVIHHMPSFLAGLGRS